MSKSKRAKPKPRSGKASKPTPDKPARPPKPLMPDKPVEVKVKPSDAQPPTHDAIAAKAYEVWVAKGRPVGQDAQNWAEAEAALRGS